MVTMSSNGRELMMRSRSSFTLSATSVDVGMFDVASDALDAYSGGCRVDHVKASVEEIGDWNVIFATSQGCFYDIHGLRTRD